MNTDQPKLTMTADELFELHPLPWTHHLLLVKDANNRQVIHTGGLYDDRGRLHQGEYLSGLNALLVEFVNSRNNISDSARRAAEEIAAEFARSETAGWIETIIKRHFARCSC